jgi:branched-chain amino acid transport system substrate-binding protein
MRALVSIVAALLLIAIVCERTADAEGPLIINVVLPMTGPAAFFGKTEAEALAVYERWIDRSGGVRKRAIHFVVADSQSSPQVAVQLVNGLLGSRPSIIMGFATSAEAGAVAPLVPNGPVIYSFSPVVQPAPGSYVFASSVSAGYLIPVAIRYARDRGYHRIALIDSTDATGQESDRIVLQAMALPENQSLSLVAHERFNPSDVSVAAQIARMQAAAPDLVITFANGSAFATVMRGLLNGGLNVPVEASAANMNYDQLAQLNDVLPKDLLFNGFRYQESGNVQGPLRQKIDDFYAAFRAAGIRPSPLHLFAWDPADVVVYALRQLGPDATATQLHDFLETLHGFVGLNGVYDFRRGNQHGLSDSAVIMVRWNPKTTQFEQVSDPGGRAKR